MTKAEKKILSVAKHTLAGTAIGAVFGFVKIPLDMGAALTAPVSYPLAGAVAGALNNGFGGRVPSAAIGTLIGLCMVPMAPVSFVHAPFGPFTWGAAGGVVGGIVGVMDNEKEDK